MIWRGFVMLGKCRAQVMGFWIAVLPLIRLRHRGNSARGGAKNAFIRAKAGLECGAAGALLGFGADERHGGRQRGSERGKASMCHGTNRYKLRKTLKSANARAVPACGEGGQRAMPSRRAGYFAARGVE